MFTIINQNYYSEIIASDILHFIATATLKSTNSHLGISNLIFIYDDAYNSFKMTPVPVPRFLFAFQIQTSFDHTKISNS